jgi:uncharacterized surface protein with fasciclin (FAS1) repeats
MIRKLFYLTCICAIAGWGCQSNTENSTETVAEPAETEYEGGQATVVDEVSDANIVAVAVGSPDHTTLVAAVQAAGLVDVLANNGPFTVFAPTNAAFDKLPEGTLEELTKPENKATLARIITYHAVPGIYQGKVLESVDQLYMATGHYVPVEQKEDGTYVKGVKILGTVQATNGVVHVIDEVLLPPDE